MKPAFKTDFAPYVCEGDNISCELDGFTFTATLHRDYDSRPDEYECYTAKQIAAWKNDDWHYFGVVISVHCDDIEISDHAASLWSIEGNFPSRRKNPNKYFREVANDLLSEALDVARRESARIVSTLAKHAA